jgi:hypothetical protein
MACVSETPPLTALEELAKTLPGRRQHSAAMYARWSDRGRTTQGGTLRLRPGSDFSGGIAP